MNGALARAALVSMTSLSFYRWRMPNLKKILNNILFLIRALRDVFVLQRRRLQNMATITVSLAIWSVPFLKYPGTLWDWKNF